MITIRWVYVLVIIVFAGVWFSAQAQGPWSKMGTSDFDPDQFAESRPMPTSYSVYTLELDDLLANLNAHLRVILPLPGNRFQAFSIRQISNFHPVLAEKYPDIRSYAGHEPGSESYRVRFSVSHDRFSAVMSTPDGEVYVDPLEAGNTIYYMVYYTRDFLPNPEIRDRMQSHTHHFEGDAFPDFQMPPNSPFSRSRPGPVELRKYDLALSCTGEYTQRHGGTKAGALAAMNVALDRINFLLETEVAISLQLIAQNDELVFTNAATDPFTNGNAGQMALENNNYLTANLASAEYDVGHIFGTLCSNIVGTSGGIGTVCGSTKGYGSSCEISSSDRFYIGIVCHELGHQFGARHTWNYCPLVSDDQFSGGTAFEPGSGTTLMAYAGACGNQNVQFMEDSYYHNNSLAAIAAFSRSGNGNTCAEVLPTGNSHPAVEILHPDGLFIPISTPFKLTCEGSDPDGDSITYAWEQYDAGIGQAGMTPLGMPVGNSPIFRSVRPSASPSRIFPALGKILDNQFDDTEVLPTYNRDLTFRVTVRDNRLGGGGVSWDEIRFKSSSSAGPFEVTSFQDSQIIKGGSYMEVNWDVANTDQAPVSCHTVHVLLSIDGGNTFPRMLAENTPNDGSVMVTIPNVITGSARIMIEAADNIFFDISNVNFTIIRPIVPTAILDIQPNETFVCLPENIDLTLKSASIAGFDDSIQLTAVTPPEISVSFTNNTIYPGDSSLIQLDFGMLTESGQYTIDIIGVTESGDTLVRPVHIIVTSNDFTDLSLLSPSGSGVEQRPEFVWLPSKNATGYILEVSGDPAFKTDVISSGPTTGFSITLNAILEENSLYFWRVIPYNTCGFLDPTSTKAFHTINLICERFNGSDLPKPLSQSVTPTITSHVMVGEAGVISDVNVAEIAGFHEGFDNLTFILQGPDSSRVTLLRGRCGFSSRQFRFGFDDQSADMLDCRVAFTGQVFQPEAPLQIFNGKDRMGAWSLLIKDTLIGAGGQIDRWTLELCGSVEVSPPVLVLNDTLLVDQNKSAPVTGELLKINSSTVGADQLLFRIVKTPSKGHLFDRGQPLEAGDQFSQQDINAGLISYVHQSADTLPDHFDFVVQDGLGGWIDITSFQITVRSTTVAVQQPDLEHMVSIFPNPSNGEVFIKSSLAGKIWLLQIDGKVLDKSTILPGLNYRYWTSIQAGLYLIRFVGDGVSSTWKLVIVDRG